MRNPVFLLFAVLAFAPPSLALADEGRIPIYQPTTIAQPGHYVVTRDFTASGNAVFIQANQVTLDLGGHTLTGTAGCGASVISIDTSVATTGLIIRNGVIKGGCLGIGSGVSNPVQIRIENVEVAGSGSAGIGITNPGVVEVIGCHVHDTSGHGIATTPAPLNSKGRFIGNTIERTGDDGLHLVGLAQGEVRGNLISDFGANGPGRAGILLAGISSIQEAGGNLVAGNAVSSYPSGIDDDGIYIVLSRNNLVVDNVARKNGRYGIWSAADGTRLERNVVGANGSHGFLIGADGVSGLRNYLVSNQAQDNLAAGSCGISFLNGPSHVYRENNVRGNSVAGFCGAANTDAGGNIP